MKSLRNHTKKSSKLKGGSAEAAGGNYWSQPCIRLMPVTICSSETGRGCCPHPRVRRLQKKTATAAPLALSLDRGCRFLDEGNCGGAGGMIKWVRVRWWRWVERRTFWKAMHNWGSGSRRMQAPGKLNKRRVRSAS